MKPRCLTLIAGLIAAGAPAALAQAPPAPPPLKLPAGIKVRVWAHSMGGQRIEGTLLSADASAVTLIPKGEAPLLAGEMRLPAGDVTRLDVALDKKSHWWQGALIGAAVGLAMAFTDDVDPVLCEVNENVLCSRGEAVLVYGLASVGLGAGIGAFVKTDRWTPVALDAFGPPSPPVLRESRAPISVGVTFRF
jgi:hypothetical protein